MFKPKWLPTVHQTYIGGLCALASLAALPAQSSILTLDQFRFPYPSGNQYSDLAFHIANTNAPATALDVYAGQLSATWNDGSGDENLLLYCVDIYRQAQFGVSYSTYTELPAVPYFSVSVADALGRFYAGFGDSVIDATTSAAFQLGVWEIVYETHLKTPYNVSSGNFSVSSFGVNAAQEALAIGDANSWLAQLPSIVNHEYVIEVLHNPGERRGLGTQDFITGHSVPEPSSLPLFGLGVAALWLARNRLRVR